MSLKTPEEIEVMAEGGRRLARVLRSIAVEVRAGVTGLAIDRMAEELIRAGGDKPAFKDYRPHGAARPYPATICFSVNETVVHGIPSARPVQDGDIVKIDIGLVHEGWYADMAVTVAVGGVAPAARRLIETARTALDLGIVEARPGNTLGDIGAAIEEAVRGAGFSVAQSLTGHGIGRRLHEDPWVMNTGRRGMGEELAPGMVIAIEPMIAAGKGAVRQLSDDSFVMKDGSMAAHFEHTIAITEKGPRVLTMV